MTGKFAIPPAAIGHPLTVHGAGGQPRAFIHISDTVRCVEIAISHPPQPDDRPMVLNQVTETHRVMDLAKLVGDTRRIRHPCTTERGPCAV